MLIAFSPNILTSNYIVTCRELITDYFVTPLFHYYGLINAGNAAIRGGMREEDAFTLSDGYIQRVELLSEHGKIMNLQYNMILEFTEQVEKLHLGHQPTGLAADVANYVRHHLSEPISTERMAEEFYLSRPYLSAKFKHETGETLTDFILREKAEEAKRLLRWSDKSAASIGAYLGFSSHSHFIRVFKKYAGVTPSEFREKHCSL